METIISGIPVFYEQYGEGKPIIAIHGYRLDHRMMAACMEPVFKDTAGYKRIYVDLPGRGKTPSSPLLSNADKMVSFLIELIDNIVGGQNLLLVGESYGGYLSLGLLHEIKDRIDGVFLLCPQVFTENQRKPPRQILNKSPEMQQFTGADFDAFKNMAVTLTPYAFDRYKNEITPAIALSDSSYLSTFTAQLTCNDDLLKMCYDKPSCILTGRQDHVVGYASAYDIFENFTRCSYAVLDSTGHCLQIENPTLFNHFLSDWLSRTANTVYV